MKIDTHEWRMITFCGVAMPHSLMAITCLGNAVLELGDEADEWLQELATCRGRRRTRAALECEQFAREAVTAIDIHLPEVLAYLKAHLSSHGFDPGITATEWHDSLQLIEKLAGERTGMCDWSAPGLSSDALGTPEKVDAFTRALNATAKKSIK
jgi:hypothetical protein